MYIEVIPLKYSLSCYPYTYFVPEIWKSQIVLGGFVEIPMGKNIDFGIIAKILDILPEVLQNTDMKPILSVTAATPLLANTQIESIQHLAQLYCIPIHRMASLLFPTPLRSRLDKRNYLLEKPQDISHMTQSVREILMFTESIFSPNDLDSYMEMGTVFIFPDDFFLLQFTKKVSHRKDILILPNDATDTKRSQAWIDIYEKKYSIIFWTRRILYYNLEAYSHMIYIEDAFGGEQFQYPSKIRSLDIFSGWIEYMPRTTIVTSSPTLELFHRFRQFSLRNIHSSF